MQDCTTVKILAGKLLLVGLLMMKSITIKAKVIM